jgi:hypothetical protein
MLLKSLVVKPLKQAPGGAIPTTYLKILSFQRDIKLLLPLQGGFGYD